MKDKLTIKQMNFARFIFEGHTQREAWGLAGYSTKYAPAIIDINACNLAKQNKIQLRINEMQAAIDSKAVASKEERQKVLTEIVRGRVNQYVQGNRINATVNKLNSAAVSEVVTQEIQLGKGDEAAVVDVVKLKLRDPVAAIAELNKMDGAYPREQVDLNVNINVISRIPRPMIESTATVLDATKKGSHDVDIVKRVKDDVDIVY